MKNMRKKTIPLLLLSLILMSGLASAADTWYSETYGFSLRVDDGTMPVSSVDHITPYWRTSSPISINATASDTGSGLKNVTLEYRFSGDNISWGGYVTYGVNATPWMGCSWNFSFSNGTGYYEFYSIAADNASHVEEAPGSADAMCNYSIVYTTAWHAVTYGFSLRVGDGSEPISSVDPISPYMQTTSPLTITADASDTGSGLKNVTLWHRFSMDNASWGGYTSFAVDAEPWTEVSWSFTFPNGTGFYEFYSIAADNASNTEDPPGLADAICNYSIASESAWHALTYGFSLRVVNAPPTSSASAITPSWYPLSTPNITINYTASASAGLNNVTLYYRYSSDELTWGDWTHGAYIDTDPWTTQNFNFTFIGDQYYYQFYTIASDNLSNIESPPAAYDAYCNHGTVNGTWHSESYGISVRVQDWGSWSDWWDMTLSSVGQPTSFTASNSNSSSISLSWTEGTHATTTRILQKKDSYPSAWNDTSAGLVYNSTGTSTTSMELDIASHYYYRAWSWNATLGYSLLNASADAYTNPAWPTDVHQVANSSATITIGFTKGANASHTIVRYNTSTYPVDRTSGAFGFNSSADSDTIYGLSTNTRYYFSLWSYNETSNLYSENRSTFVAWTSYLPAPPTALAIVSYNDTRLNLSWVKGSGMATVILRKLGSYPVNHSDPAAEVAYNGTGTSFQDTGLIASKRYYYRAWSYQSPLFSELNASANGWTRPRAPVNGSSSFDVDLIAVNFTWYGDNGTTHDRMIKKTGSYPTSYLDGTLVQNTTDNYKNYYNYTSAVTNTYFKVYGFNSTTHLYSRTGTEIPWGALLVNVYNESNPSQGLNDWSIQIKNHDGTQVYQSDHNSNPFYLDVLLVPHGPDVVIKVWQNGYNYRIITQTLSENMFTSLNFYLPPDVTQSGGGGTGDCYYRSFTNSITIGDPDVDAVITFSHTPVSIDSVEKYNTSIDRTRLSYIDTASVTTYYYTHNLYITLTNDLASLIAVEVYNKSASGGYGAWMPVPTNYYAYIEENNTVNISHMFLASNTTLARITYYYWEAGTYGGWQFIPEPYCTSNATALTINHSILDEYTSMVRVTYTYEYCPGQPEEMPLYYCRVLDPYGSPVVNAFIWFQTYINTTGIFVNVSTLYTDGNGYVSVYLIPENLYQVIIVKSGFERYLGTYQPSRPDQYGQTIEKIFRLYFINYTYNATEQLWDYLEFSVHPGNHYQNGSFMLYFNISSSRDQLEWYAAAVYFYNETLAIWVLIGTTNETVASGGCISFAIPNVTGKYVIVSAFKKMNFSAYQLGYQYFFVYTRQLQRVEGLPAEVYLMVTIFLMILGVGAVALMGAGPLSGIIGICIEGFMFGIRPDLSFGDPPVSCWFIFIATVIAFFFLMFILRER